MNNQERPKRRHKGKEILNDRGEKLPYICPYTKLEIAGDPMFLGSVVPQVVGVYACHPSALPFFKKARYDFDEFEQNCNTCQNLVRLPSVKDGTGILKGHCKIKPEGFIFHPEDFMGMECHIPRPFKEETK